MARKIAPKRKLPPEPLMLLIDINVYSPGFSFGVPWQMEDRRPWTEWSQIEIFGPIIRPRVLPKVARQSLQLRIFPDREMTPERTPRLDAIGRYGVYAQRIACTAYLPLDSFTALLAMGPMKYLWIKLAYPEHRQGNVLDFTVDRDDSRLEDEE
jgi:hypothetical protein